MVRAMPSEGIQGDEWAAYVTLGRMTETYAGSPTGCEPYGDGEPIVAVGVTPHQGVRESRMQGEVAQVIQRPETRKVCEIAERRNGAGCLARARQAWSAAGEAVSATVQGVTAETVDGMSLAKIGRIIAAVRAERWRWRPVKRVHIPKRNGKRRALGLPTWSDKLLAEVVRMLLDAYYDPTTTPSSPTTPTGSDPAGAATPRSARSWRSGRGRTGSSRATSPSASTRLIAR